MKKEEYDFWLTNLYNIGPRKIELLLKFFGRAVNVFEAAREDLDKVKNDSIREGGTRFLDSDIDTIINNRDWKKTQESYEKLKNSGISFITKEDERYPGKLKQIYDAPFALYVKGMLPPEGIKVLAVVGARECSNYGKEMAKYLAGAVAREGIAIISGLARGIDSFAHEGALAAEGITYGVLGCGIDICYPKENLNLYMDMQKQGGIISEYAPGVKPLAGNFPMRNRIISGLCDRILVIEAKEKSGSLITVDMGLEQGKDIYAVPGRAIDALSVGCNNLIKMGAKLVTTPKDILEDFLPEYLSNNGEQNKAEELNDTQENKIYSSLNYEPKHMEEIAILTSVPMDFLMERLLSLELRGLICQPMKNYYSKPITL
jgi:DNA processing protein